MQRTKTKPKPCPITNFFYANRSEMNEMNRFLSMGMMNTEMRAKCKDKLSTKKCKKLKKKGKCEDKKTYKKCMETCQKCTQGTIAIDNLLPSKFKG